MRVTLPGMIPVFEEHMARRAGGYTLFNWYKLKPMLRAFEAALFRMSRAVDAESIEDAK